MPKIYPTGGDSLPDQTGNSGEFLTTDGTNAAWAPLAGGGDMAAAVYDPQAIGDDAFDRANHTGEQAISTVTGLQTALDGKSATTHDHDADYAALVHTHDDRYYTETEVDALLDGIESGTGAVSQRQTVWAATHDAGSLIEWYAPDTTDGGNEGGGPFVNDGATATASTTYARSGTYSAALTIPADPPSGGAGARLFRWLEPNLLREAYYDVWLYFPTLGVASYSDPGSRFWQVFQFKSRDETEAHNDPFWIVDIVNPDAETMRLRLTWWGNMDPAEGPHESESGFRAYTQTTADIPVGEWVNVTVWVRQNTAGNFDGALKMWQGGDLLFDLTDIRTGYDNTVSDWGTDLAWSVNNYTNGVNGGTAYTVYVDDARILTDVPAETNPDQSWTPAEYGWLGATYDPVMITSQSQPASGFAVWSRITVQEAGTIAAVLVPVTTAGATLTADTCWVALYNDVGDLIGQSTDQSASWNSAGLKRVDVTAANGRSLAVVPGQWVWVMVTASGTTRPQFARSTSTNASVSAIFGSQPAGYAVFQRKAYSSGGITTPPGTIAETSYNDYSPYWLAVTT